MNSVIPRIVIAGTQSGVGKTSVTLGIVAALRRRGLRVQTFKVGPDYLDPTYLNLASGRPCYNLDGWMADRPYVEALFQRVCEDADVAIIEGVMGLFDGADPSALDGSTAEIAQWLDVPVVLVANAHGAGRSFAAMVHGFTTFDPEIRVAGVIANRCGSERHAQGLAESLTSASLPTLLGSVQRGALPELPSRHLGLVTADPVRFSQQLLDQLADAVEKAVSLEAVLEAGRVGRAGILPANNDCRQDALSSVNSAPCRDGSAGILPATNPRGQDARADFRESVVSEETHGFFNPFDEIEIHEHYLPHWQQTDSSHFVTWRLADALPESKLGEWTEQRDAWLKHHPEPWSDETVREYHTRFGETIDRWLDKGSGSCLLRQREVATAMAGVLRHFDGNRYDLSAFVIMPNHVHVLFRLREGHQIGQVVNSWKSFSAKQINELCGRRGPLWQEDYWDRMIRNEAHLAACLDYIRDNPKRAGLHLENCEHFEVRAGVLPACERRGQDAHAPVPARGANDAAGRMPANNNRGQDAHAPVPEIGSRVMLGVARDEAFHFYYPDNLDALEQAGCTLVPFSPLRDRSLPPGLHGIYIGGGYPEEHAPALAANLEMLDAIRQFAAADGLVYAECGGLMYLSEGIETLDGVRHPLLGILPAWTRMQPQRKSLGYVGITLTRDCLWGRAGESLRGHEFHYSSLIESPAGWDTAYALEYRRSDTSVAEGFQRGSVLASYTHVHFASQPWAIENFLCCLRRHTP